MMKSVVFWAVPKCDFRLVSILMVKDVKRVDARCKRVNGKTRGGNANKQLLNSGLLISIS